jgi:hypothetical protein
LLKYRDKTDRTLFFASTLITVGNGRNTPFWEAKWLNGAAPMELVPNLYQQARFKYILVHQELQNLNWIINIKNINTEELMDELFLLCTVISEVSLNDSKDSIVWKWTEHGEYTAASAYEAQFLGAFSTFNASTI